MNLEANNNEIMIEVGRWKVPKQDWEKWENDIERMKEINAKIFDKNYHSWLDDVQKLYEKIEGCKSKHENWKNVLAFHIFSGSSFENNIKDIENADFPGDDSIEKFAKELLEKRNKN